jgi:hypothetical protein
MPRRPRRTATEDQIEEPASSANPRSVDEVDDADVPDNDIPTAGPSSRKSKPKANGRVNGTIANGEAEGNGEESEADEPIDVNKFEDQAVSRKEAKNLSMLSSDWAQMVQIVRNSTEMMPDIGAAMAEVEGPDADQACINVFLFSDDDTFNFCSCRH